MDGALGGTTERDDKGGNGERGGRQQSSGSGSGGGSNGNGAGSSHGGSCAPKAKPKAKAEPEPAPNKRVRKCCGGEQQAEKSQPPRKRR